MITNIHNFLINTKSIKYASDISQFSRLTKKRKKTMFFPLQLAFSFPFISIFFHHVRSFKFCKQFISFQRLCVVFILFFGLYYNLKRNQSELYVCTSELVNWCWKDPKFHTIPHTSIMTQKAR